MGRHDVASFLENVLVWIHLQLLDGVEARATINHKANTTLFSKFVRKLLIQIE